MSTFRLPVIALAAVALLATTGALWARFGEGVFIDFMNAGGFGCLF
jgi:hypothetical protein